MYSDHRNTGREGWKYTYKGGDLLEPAKTRLVYWQGLERELRDKLAAHFKGTGAITGSKIQKVQESARHAGMMVEQLQVFVHEFTRFPDREYLLAMGDVVFFGIAGTPAGGEQDDE